MNVKIAIQLNQLYKNTCQPLTSEVRNCQNLVDVLNGQPLIHLQCSLWLSGTKCDTAACRIVTRSSVIISLSQREFWFRNGIGKTCLWKNMFYSTNKDKLGKKEFLKLCIVLFRADLNCTIKASRMGRPASVS